MKINQLITKTKTMTNLNEEQKDYFKSLKSNKKRRKFFTDCLIENLLKENEKLEEINRLNSQYTNYNATRVLGLNTQIKDILEFDALKDVDVYFLSEINNYLIGKNVFLEINEVQDLKKIFLKYHESANSK